MYTCTKHAREAMAETPMNRPTQHGGEKVVSLLQTKIHHTIDRMPCFHPLNDINNYQVPWQFMMICINCRVLKFTWWEFFVVSLFLEDL